MSEHPFIGGNMSISMRYGFAIVTVVGKAEAALMAPSMGPDRITFDLVQWCDTRQDAVVLVGALHAAGVTPDDIRDRKNDESQEQGEGPEPEGGRLQITTGAEPEAPTPEGRAGRLVTAIARASGLAVGVVAAIITGEPDGSSPA